jgi:hypothetical protein
VQNNLTDKRGDYCTKARDVPFQFLVNQFKGLPCMALVLMFSETDLKWNCSGSIPQNSYQEHCCLGVTELSTCHLITDTGDRECHPEISGLANESSGTGRSGGVGLEDREGSQLGLGNSDPPPPGFCHSFRFPIYSTAVVNWVYEVRMSVAVEGKGQSVYSAAVV